MRDANFYIIGSKFSPFSGSFNGNDHTILNLTITGKDYVGLFGQLAPGAEIKNLGVVDANTTSSFDSDEEYGSAGALVGFNIGGTLTNCYSTGTVSGTSSVGGLVGRNYGTVAQCYSTGAVNGTNSVGGLVGENAGTVTDCYSTCAVSGIRFNVGGLVGCNENDCTIIQCYSTGAVSGDWEVGGLVGYSFPGAVTGCFWDTQTSGQTTSASGTGKTTAEMQTSKTFLDAGWDFVGETVNGTEDIWWILEGKDYPRLWWEHLP